MPIKKFIGHISAAIAVSNRSRAQSDQIGVGIAFDNSFNTTGPLWCPRMMELIENNRICMNIKISLLRSMHGGLIRHALDVLELMIRQLAPDGSFLLLLDIGRGRHPENSLIRMIEGITVRYKRLACPGRMNDAGTPGPRQHIQKFAIRLFIMWIQFQSARHLNPLCTHVTMVLGYHNAMQKHKRRCNLGK